MSAVISLQHFVFSEGCLVRNVARYPLCWRRLFCTSGALTRINAGSIYPRGHNEEKSKSTYSSIMVYVYTLRLVLNSGGHNTLVINYSTSS